jgi:hypothetical protein
MDDVEREERRKVPGPQVGSCPNYAQMVISANGGPAVPGESGLLRNQDRRTRPAFRVTHRWHGYLLGVLPESSPGAVE